MKIFTVVIMMFLLTLTPVFGSEPTKAEQEKSFVRSEDVIGNKIGYYQLVDQDGRTFSTGELAGKPYVVSLIYATCIHICPTITQSLASAVKAKEERFGIDFNIITVSFDPERDTPEKLREYGSNFTKDFKNWRFTTADKETIDRMARDLGFYYKKEGEHFQHINMVSVIGADQTVLAHIYGIDFRPDQVLDPIYKPHLYGLKGKREGFSAFVNKVILYCYKYDPATNSYRLDYALIVKMLLEGTLLFSILFFVWKKEIMNFLKRIFRRPAGDEVQG